MIHEYKTGRSVCGFVEFIAWVGVIAAGIALLVALGTAFDGKEGVFALLAVLPAFSALLSCFLMIVIVQMARAAMDASVASQKMLVESREHHREVMTAMRRGPDPTSASRSIAEKAQRPEQNEPAQIRSQVHAGPDAKYQIFQGFRIYHDDNGYRVGGQTCRSIEEAHTLVAEMVEWQSKMVRHGMG